MRIARFVHRGTTRLGAVEADAVRPLPPGAGLLALLAAAPGDRARLAAGSEGPIAVDDVHLLAPLEPPSFRDFVAFEEHVEGVVRSVTQGAGVVPEWYEARRFYFSNPAAVVGAHEPVAIPPGCEAWTTSSRWPSSSPAGHATSRPWRRAAASAVTRSSTTGRRATYRGRR